jgi:replicative DNA helicase
MELIGKSLQQFKDQMERIAAGKEKSLAIKTGFQSLDQLSGGYRRGEIAVVAGRPGMGVSAFLLESAINLAQQHGYHGAYITLDQPLRTVQARIASIFTDVPLSELINGHVNHQVLEKLSWTSDQSSLGLYLHEQKNRDLYDLLNVVRDIQQKQPLDFIVIDYLQLLTSADAEKHRSRFDHLNTLMEKLQTYARENNVALICGSSMSRKVEDRGGDKRPQLSDIRESGLIEEMASKVMFLYRPEYYGIHYDMDGVMQKGVMEGILVKNETGSSGSTTFFAGGTDHSAFRVLEASDGNNSVIDFLSGDHSSPF